MTGITKNEPHLIFTHKSHASGKNSKLDITLPQSICVELSFQLSNLTQR